MAERALKNSEQGVQRLDGRTLAAALDQARWDDLAAFACVAATGSLRRAASEQRISVNTVRARIARLEQTVGVTLVQRTPEGTATTAAGRSVAEAVATMRRAAAASGGEISEEVLRHPGELVIGCSEGLASLWLTPRLAALQARIPRLTVSLQSDYDLSRDRSGEVDVGLAFAPPANPDLIVSRIGALHMMLFASAAYLREFGAPASLDDFPRHRFIEQASPGLNPSLLDYFVGRERSPGFIPIRSNSSLSVFWAVASGAGIAALPTYVRAVSRRVTPLDLPLQLRFDLYYYYQGSARRTPAVRHAIDWLQEAFDARRYPWFADRFIHPDSFADEGASAKIVSLFSTFDELGA